MNKVSFERGAEQTSDGDLCQKFMDQLQDLLDLQAVLLERGIEVRDLDFEDLLTSAGGFAAAGTPKARRLLMGINFTRLIVPSGHGGRP